MQTSCVRRVDLSGSRLHASSRRLLRLGFHPLTHKRRPLSPARTRPSKWILIPTVPVIDAEKEAPIQAISGTGIEKSDPSKSLKNAVWKFLAILGVLLCLKLLAPRLSLAETAQKTGFSFGSAFKSEWKFEAYGLPLCSGFLDFFLHLDKHLSAIIVKYGTMTYALLFGIVFCETGLVLTPLLPGDSLLFAAGTMAGLGKLNITYLFAIFIIAAILGDAVNYSIGSWLGQKAIESKFISKSAIEETEAFYEKHGGKTIVLARFVPIVRTFAPFVAGVSHMAYRAFAAYNVGGAILWTVLFCGGGYYFGNLPFVEKNFSIVVLAIVVVSVLPTLFEVIAARRRGKQ